MKQYKIYTIEKGIVETDNYDDISDLTWHREDGPVYIEHRIDDSIEREIYYFNNQHHRLDGHAYIKYDIKGNMIYIVYWINGIKYTKDQYDKELLKRKINLLNEH